MHVLKFATQAEAEARSFQEAANRLGESHTTELWWGWVHRPDDALPYWLLCEPDTEGAIDTEAPDV